LLPRVGCWQLFVKFVKMHFLLRGLLLAHFGVTVGVPEALFICLEIIFGNHHLIPELAIRRVKVSS